MLSSTRKFNCEIHKPFTPEELQTLWQHVDDFRVKVSLILCYIGLRPSELAQIRTADVHLSEQYMSGGMKIKLGNKTVTINSNKYTQICA